MVSFFSYSRATQIRGRRTLFLIFLYIYLKIWSYENIFPKRIIVIACIGILTITSGCVRKTIKEMERIVAEVLDYTTWTVGNGIEAATCKVG